MSDEAALGSGREESAARRPLWLIGMMGVGKTSIGALLAERVSVPFYDTDAMVVEMSGMPISQLWQIHGEPGFRELERRAVAAVPQSRCIGSAGGGAVIDAANREIIARSRAVVWLRCQTAILAGRTQGHDRPLLGGQDPEGRLRSLYDEREPLYESLATHSIDTGIHAIDESVALLADIWNV